MFHPEGPTLRELLVQGFSSLERGYDLLAARFEHTPFRTPDAVLAPTIVAALPAPVTSALDLACGTGAVLRHLRPHVTGRLVGLDLSRGMLEEARRLLEHVPGPARVELVQGDLLAHPFREAFELVTCFGAFGHVKEADEPALVEAVRRALVPGGRFVFVTADAPAPWRPAWWAARGFNALWRVRNALWRPPFVMYYLTFRRARARALLEAAGFTVRERAGLFARPYRRLVLVEATRGR